MLLYMRFPLRLTGLIAAPHTPLRADGSLAPDVIPRQAQLLRAAGVQGVFVGGTTGESVSLTGAERRAVAEEWMAAVGGRLPVIVHVGGYSLPDCRELARHAAEVGATAISIMAPGYFKPAGLDDLIDFCAAVAAAAPRTPLYFYDIPAMTGVPIPTARFLREGQERIPTLHGVKFTNGDLMTLQECLAVESCDVLFGYDEMLLAALALGARGAVGATYNFAAPLYQRILAAFERSDLAAARQAQRQSVALIRLLQEFGFARASKAMMRLLGVDCGPVRPPLRAMTEPEVRALYERLQGFDGLSRALQAPG